MANRLSGELAGWVIADDAALRARLERRRGSPAEDHLRPRARALFARVLYTPGGIKIQTIHAFCQSLLSRFPLEAGVAPNARVLDEHEAADLLETARVVVLAEALAGQGRLSDEIAVLTAHLQDDRFTEVMQQLIHQRGRLADLKAARGNGDRLVADIFALLRVDRKR